ncbi:MAG: elements of external origin, partial [Burkholderiaceae bacterium]
MLTQAEYAKRRGCSAVAVHKAVKAGRISLIDGKIDPAVADIQWGRNTRARAANRAPGAGAVQTSERPGTVD